MQPNISRAISTKVLAVLVVGFLAVPSLPVDAHAGETPRMLDPNVLPDKPDLSGLPRLRFLTSLDFPPFNFSDATKRPTGFNVDMARAICATLEIEEKCEIQALPWDELRDALEARRGEAIIAGNAITAEARAELALSQAYFRFPARFVTRRPAEGQPSSLQDDIYADLSGKTVAVEEGSAHAVMLETHFPDANASLVADQQAGYAALKDGEADFLFGDGVSLSFFLASPAADKCCVFAGGPYFDSQFLGKGMAVAVRQSDGDLLQAIEHALALLERDGQYGEIFSRYFPLSPYAPAGTGP